MTAGRRVNPKSRDWCTPPQYVEAVRAVLGEITLDPCSNKYSVVRAGREYSLPNDGLALPWKFPTIYVNPPYGADRERRTNIRDWLAKCDRAHVEHRAEVLALVPVATNTRHWKEHVFGAATSVAFLYDTRLRFMLNGELETKGASMACAMIYWGRKLAKFEKVFTRFGAVLDLRGLARRTGTT